MNPIHIVTEKENIKENVLLPGDPLRAQYIAEKYHGKTTFEIEENIFSVSVTIPNQGK